MMKAPLTSQIYPQKHLYRSLIIKYEEHMQRDRQIIKYANKIDTSH